MAPTSPATRCVAPPALAALTSAVSASGEARAHARAAKSTGSASGSQLLRRVASVRSFTARPGSGQRAARISANAIGSDASAGSSASVAIASAATTLATTARRCACVTAAPSDAETARHMGSPGCASASTAAGRIPPAPNESVPAANHGAPCARRRDASMVACPGSRWVGIAFGSPAANRAHGVARSSTKARAYMRSS